MPEYRAAAAPVPEPILPPSTKAEQGTHDENITFERVHGMIGTELARRARDASIEIYTAAATAIEPIITA